MGYVCENKHAINEFTKLVCHGKVILSALPSLLTSCCKHHLTMTSPQEITTNTPMCVPDS